LLCGIRQAHYELLSPWTMTCKTRLKEIPGLLAKLAEGYDVVYGTPERERHGLWA